MKHCSLIVFLLFCIYFQKGLLAQNTLLIKSIEYDVPIINKDLCQGSELSETDWWKRNIESSKRWYFQQALLNNAIAGKIKVYDDKGNEISDINLKKLLTTTDTVMMTRKKPPYNFYDTVITKYISSSEIHSIRFKESWFYDPATYEISKKIESYSPLISVDRTVNVLNKTKTIAKDIPLFWIKCSENSEEKNMVTLTDFILYNCPLYKNTDVIMPQFGHIVNISPDTSERKYYVDTLIGSVSAGKIKSYISADFSGYYDYTIDSLIPLSKKEIEDIAFHHDSLTLTRSVAPYDQYDIATRSKVHASMIRFHEGWLLDPKTMNIKKEVLAVSPCEYVYDKSGNFKGIKPLFLVMFGKPVRCFAE